MFGTTCKFTIDIVCTDMIRVNLTESTELCDIHYSTVCNRKQSYDKHAAPFPYIELMSMCILMCIYFRIRLETVQRS